MPTVSFTGTLAPAAPITEEESLFAGLLPDPPAEPLDEGAITPALSADRRLMIEAIERCSAALGASPRREWLDSFTTPALEEYLAHLQAAARPRGKGAIWVRPSHARAISGAVAPE
ncbi:MAG: hypothetical protein AB7K52_08515 [Phycisphaerales bacterium]